MPGTYQIFWHLSNFPSENLMSKRILLESQANSSKPCPPYGLGSCVYPKPVNDDSLAESSARQFPLEKLHRERIGR